MYAPKEFGTAFKSLVVNYIFMIFLPEFRLIIFWNPCTVRLYGPLIKHVVGCPFLFSKPPVTKHLETDDQVTAVANARSIFIS